MEHGRRKTTALIGDLGRLIAPLDIFYTIGNLIYRRSLRYTLVTAGIAVVGLVAGRIGLPGFTVRQALVLPLLIGGLSLAVGVLLKVVPSLIASRLLTVAQASDLNLMEDYRKSQTDEHLGALWRRLFQHECRLHMASRQPGPVARVSGQTENEALARAKASFFVRAKEALSNPLPQIQQMFRVGLDLRFFEDWRDGAYFDRSDSKLIEQFDGNSTLLAARGEVGLTGLAATMLLNPRRTAQRFWFAVVTRMVAILTATDVQKLNRAHDTDLFNSQMLLWPGTEDGDWLSRLPGAREELLRCRLRNIKRIFGRDLATARCVLDHMLYCGFAAATELRMRFDPDYCDGRLGYDVIEDLTAEGRNRRDFQRAKGFVGQALPRLAALEKFCNACRPELLSAAGAEDLRTARLAVHINRDGLHDLLGEWEAHTAETAAECINRALDNAVEHKDIHARRLLAVRMHHELTRLTRQGYADLVEALGYGPQRPANAAAAAPAGAAASPQEAEPAAKAEHQDC